MTWTHDPKWQALTDAGLAERGWPEDVETPYCMRHDSGELAALVGREPPGGRLGAPLRWHISLQHRDRMPTFDDARKAAHELRPGVLFVVGIPPEAWWNADEPQLALHLWEVADPLLAEEYHRLTQKDRPV